MLYKIGHCFPSNLFTPHHHDNDNDDDDHNDNDANDDNENDDDNDDNDKRANTCPPCLGPVL